MKIIISEAARDDLRNIEEWIAQADPVRAESFVDELLLRIEGLGAFPERFSLADAIRSDRIRRCVHKGYRILYEVVGSTVTILHVHHGARDRPGS